MHFCRDQGVWAKESEAKVKHPVMSINADKIRFMMLAEILSTNLINRDFASEMIIPPLC